MFDPIVSREQLVHKPAILILGSQTIFVVGEGFSMENIRIKHLLSFNDQAAPKPAYLRDGLVGFFYIGIDPASTFLPLAKVYNYIRERFYEK